MQFEIIILLLKTKGTDLLKFSWRTNLFYENTFLQLDEQHTFVAVNMV